MNILRKIISYNIGKKTEPAALSPNDWNLIETIKNMAENRATSININSNKGMDRVSFFVEKNHKPEQLKYSNVVIKFAGTNIDIHISDVFSGTITTELPDGYDKINLVTTRDLNTLKLFKSIIASEPKISYYIDTKDAKLASKTRKYFIDFAITEESNENIAERQAHQAQANLAEFANNVKKRVK